jgi:serine/threonine protein phosphatase PrpC
MAKFNVRLTSAAISDKGLSDKRPVNEDSFLQMPQCGLFAVADGVGGAQAGDLASQTAIEILQEAFANPPRNIDTEELLEIAIARANESIFQLSQELPQLEMMATTIVALHIEGNIATIGHAGDSRLYRLDPHGNIYRETNDHSVVEEEVRAGRMTASQAAHHPHRNVISRALGAENSVEVEMRTIMFEPGSTFLLCSDGVTRHIEDHELKEILLRHQKLADACEEIKDLCYQRGAEDNLTAVVVRVENAEAYADEENTVSRARTKFPAPNPLPTLSGRGAESLESKAEEFAEMNVVSPVATTAPLDNPPEEFDTNVNLRPASQTLGVTDAPQPEDRASHAPTLQSKLDNERIRAKIDAAEPLSGYQEESSGSAFGKILSSLLLLALGAIIGAGGHFAYSMLNPPNANAPAASNSNTTTPPPPLNAKSDMSAQEINEFTQFERVRRTIDKDPKTAESRFDKPETAADFYLRGRAHLLFGDVDAARKDFEQAAAQFAANNAGGVNAETLKNDIAIARAAVGALAQTTANDKKPLDEIIKSQKNGLNTPGASNNNSPAAAR